MKSTLTFLFGVLFAYEILAAATPPEAAVETFESQGFQAFPWQMGGAGPWLILSSGAYKGTHCARSGNTGDGQSSFMSISLHVSESGHIRFARRVSSEQGFDFLKFYIDGEEKARWSGSVVWGEVAFPVTTGLHTFTWSYEKDGAGASGIDRAIVDEIIFPPHEVSVSTTFQPQNDLSFGVKISPNPIITTGEVSIEVFEKQELSLRVLDLEGRQLAIVLPNTLLHTGQYIYPLEMSSLAAGMYALELRTRRGSMLKKIQKL
jgi:hypothetical protein